eukprot:217902-Chlamydomonas_euryale.AAC.3
MIQQPHASIFLEAASFCFAATLRVSVGVWPLERKTEVWPTSACAVRRQTLASGIRAGGAVPSGVARSLFAQPRGSGARVTRHPRRSPHSQLQLRSRRSFPCPDLRHSRMGQRASMRRWHALLPGVVLLALALPSPGAGESTTGATAIVRSTNGDPELKAILVRLHSTCTGVLPWGGASVAAPGAARGTRSSYAARAVHRRGGRRRRWRSTMRC